MNRDDDQKLWDLLGKAEAPQASPFFSRNILRAVRVEPRSFTGLRSLFLWPRIAAVGGLSAAILLAGLAAHHSWNGQELRQSNSVAVSKVSGDEDFDTDIDDLVANDSDDDDVAVL